MSPFRWSVMFLVSIAGLCSTLKITTQTCFHDNGIETKCVPQILWLSVVVENGDLAFIDAQLVNKALANSSTIFVNEALETSIAREIAFVPPRSGYVIQITDTVTDNFVVESKTFEIFPAGSQILPEVPVLDPREGNIPTDSSPSPPSTEVLTVIATRDTISRIETTSASTPISTIQRSSVAFSHASPVFGPEISAIPGSSAAFSISAPFSGPEISTLDLRTLPSFHQTPSLTTSNTPLQSTTAPITNPKLSAPHIGEIIGGVTSALTCLGALVGLLYYRRWRTKKASTNEPYPSVNMAQRTTPVAPIMSRPHSILSDLREELDQTMSLLATEATIEESTLNRDELRALQQRVDILQQKILQMEQQMQDANMTRWGSNFDEPPPEYLSPTLGSDQYMWR